MDEKKVMSEKQKKEVRRIYGSEMTPQITKLQQCLRDLYEIAEETDNGKLKCYCMSNLRSLNQMRFDFENGFYLELF